MTYPLLSTWWNQYRNSRLISSYNSLVSGLEEEDYSEIWEEAREYNRNHTVNSIVDAFDEESDEYVLTHPYDQMLNPTGNEVMGYIEIPKISVNLAIYHGTGSEALEKGCGHIEGTSLPIGGENTHAVLSAHRGLPSAKLFTDLDQLQEGDVFYLHILDETLAYEVDQILTVLPNETEALQIEQGKDLVTLVTCTPYAVNTHRLLVRGHRVDYEEAMETETQASVTDRVENLGITEKLLLAGLACFAVLFLLMLLIYLLTGRRKKY